MLRFLKLIACDNGKIGTYAKLVDDRYETGGHRVGPLLLQASLSGFLSRSQWIDERNGKNHVLLLTVFRYAQHRK